MDAYDSENEVLVYRNGLSEVRCRWNIPQKIDMKDVWLCNIVPNFKPATILFDRPADYTNPEFTISYYQTYNSPHSDEDVLKHYHKREVTLRHRDACISGPDGFTGVLKAYNTDTITLLGSSALRVFPRNQLNVTYTLELCVSEYGADELRPSFFMHMSTAKKNVGLTCSYTSSDYTYAFDHFMTVADHGKSMFWESNVTLDSKSKLALAPMRVSIMNGQLRNGNNDDNREHCSTRSKVVLDIRDAEFSYPLTKTLHSTSEYAADFFYSYDPHSDGVCKVLRVPVLDRHKAQDLFFPGSVTVRRALNGTRETVGLATLSVDTNTANYVDLNLGKEKAITVSRIQSNAGRNPVDNTETTLTRYTIKNNLDEKCCVRIRDIFPSVYSEVIYEENGADVAKEKPQFTNQHPDDRVRVVEVSLNPMSQHVCSVMEKHRLEAVVS